MAVMGLTLYLSSGGTVDPGQAAQWMASGEGKRFIALSSERWRDANIAGGALPAGHPLAGRDRIAIRGTGR
jgi:hypothetical protein